MSLPDFAKWAQMIISGFSGLMLVMFWVHVQKLKREGKDRGFLYLGAGLLVWALLYALELTFPLDVVGDDGVGEQTAPPMFDRFLRRILSVTNSCLFLLTLPFFEHGFRRLHNRLGFFHDPAKWGRTVLPAAALTLVLTFLTYRIFDAPDQEWIAGLPDGIFSLIAIIGLGYAMFISFSKRQLPSLSGLTALVLLGLLGVQVLDFLNAANVTTSKDAEQIFLLLRMCSHSLLAMLFFALAFTWVIERLAPAGEGNRGDQSGQGEKERQRTLGEQSGQQEKGVTNPGANQGANPGANQGANPKDSQAGGLEERRSIPSQRPNRNAPLPPGNEEPTDLPSLDQPAGSPGDNMMVLGRNRAGKYYIELTWPLRNIIGRRISLSEGKFKYLLLAAVRKMKGEFVHGDNDVRYLYGGNIDTSNSAIKDAINKGLPDAAAIQDRGELMESKGQGSKQYRLRFAAGEIRIQEAELRNDPAVKSILEELG